MFFKLPFAALFSVLFITIQYAVFSKSFRTFYVSLYIYICAYIVYIVCIYIVYIYSIYIIYIYIYMKCIATNKYASRVLEYNNTNSKKICT